MSLIMALPVVILVIVLPLGFLFWLREVNRAPTTDIAIVPEYEPPADLGPVEAGVLVDNAFTPRDAAAMFIALRNRGFVDFTVVDDKVESLRLTGTDHAALAPLERLILDRVFAGRSVAAAAEANKALAGLRRRLADDVRRSLKEKGLYADDRLVAGIVAASSAVAAVIFSLGLVPSIGLIGAFGTAAALVLICQLGFIAVLLRPRLTRRGREVLAKLQGFRLYLSAVEGERMKWAEEKQDKIDRFTPYAIVFGISLHWAQELQKITGALLDDWTFKI